MTIEFTTMQAEVPRDRWGRPLIAPADGGKPVPYTRVSTLSKELGSKEGLTKWLQRQVVIGMSLRPDLVDMAAACRGDDKKLDEVVKTAMTAAESEKAANIGTALHALSERVDEGVPMDEIPEHHRPDMVAYKTATESLTVLAKEMFVVCDEVQAAGTFDRLVRLPDGRAMVADVKTGKWENKYPHATATQIAIYSHGHLYHPEKGRMGYLPDLGVETNTGVLIHLPAGTGDCRLYLLDLTVGWALAQAAVAVRTVLKSKPIEEYVG